MGYLETQQASKDLMVSIHEFCTWIHSRSHQQIAKVQKIIVDPSDHLISAPFWFKKIVWFKKASTLIDQIFVFVSTFPSEQPPGYDQLEGIRRSRPAFHHNLLRALLLQLADACGCFFRGCPVPWVLTGKHLG